jgi:5-(carboxyamino)imidazole ribonucleotide mutase
MPDDMFEFAERAAGRGLKAIIAGAGGAAHLPGMLAAKTTVPVLGVPVPSKHLQGVDSLYSIVQMPKGIPVATFAIGPAGAVNAALFAVAMLANEDAALRARLEDYRARQTAAARAMTADLPIDRSAP